MHGVLRHVLFYVRNMTSANVPVWSVALPAGPTRVNRHMGEGFDMACLRKAALCIISGKGFVRCPSSVRSGAGAVSGNAWAEYERQKRRLPRGLPAGEYEKRVAEICDRLGI